MAEEEKVKFEEVECFGKMFAENDPECAKCMKIAPEEAAVCKDLSCQAAAMPGKVGRPKAGEKKTVTETKEVSVVEEKKEAEVKQATEAVQEESKENVVAVTEPAKEETTKAAAPKAAPKEKIAKKARPKADKSVRNPFSPKGGLHYALEALYEGGTREQILAKLLKVREEGKIKTPNLESCLRDVLNSAKQDMYAFTVSKTEEGVLKASHPGVSA